MRKVRHPCGVEKVRNASKVRPEKVSKVRNPKVSKVRKPQGEQVPTGCNINLMLIKARIIAVVYAWFSH